MVIDDNDKKLFTAGMDGSLMVYDLKDNTINKA